MDDIFDGPRLEHGFLDGEELDRLRRGTTLRISDLIHDIMDVPGVRAVRDIRLKSGDQEETWFLKLDPDKVPAFDLENSAIRLEKDGLPVKLDTDGIIEDYRKSQESIAAEPASGVELDLVPPHVHWLDKTAMATFEAAFEDWLGKKREHWRTKYGL
uniref:Uncharacterized protein n=1 Tax=Candidatus Kentrum sp. LFY TaxID=2126342 RepID=A0A450V672_9GAMM|nr:MAG: hypothetical protein BECKLFY1418B_GA0070995_11793 [Candidatus Kentron sp. LFY]